MSRVGWAGGRAQPIGKAGRVYKTATVWVKWESGVNGDPCNVDMGCNTVRKPRVSGPGDGCLIVRWNQDPQAAEDAQAELMLGTAKGGWAGEGRWLPLTGFQPQLQSPSLVRSAIPSSLRHTLAFCLDFPDRLPSPTVTVGYGFPRRSAPTV